MPQKRWVAQIVKLSSVNDQPAHGILENGGLKHEIGEGKRNEYFEAFSPEFKFVLARSHRLNWLDALFTLVVLEVDVTPKCI
jgi:hypothetical protein